MYGLPPGTKIPNLHSLFKCPCGAEWGDLTDHPQVERLCLQHASGDGYRGGTPEYVRGHAAPELFTAFLDEHPEIPRPPGYEKPPEPPPPEPEPEKTEKAKHPRVHVTEAKMEEKEEWQPKPTRPTQSARESRSKTSPKKSR